MRGLVFTFVDINKEKECCDMKTSVSPGTQVLNTEKLMDAFQCFNELSKDLSDSYQQLQKQVVNLNKELSLARSDRLQTRVEKEK